MPGFETVTYEKSEGIAYVTLNRPRVLNALNLKMRDELWQVLLAFGDDPEVMVAIFKGAGERAFCAGADITEFSTAPSRVRARQARWERDIWGLFLNQDKPLIAALHGFALGAGLEMALCCDIRIAAEDTRLGLPEVALGMIPAAGGTQTLPRLAPGRAAELIISGRMVDAAEALRLGLVSGVVPRHELLPAAEKIARKIMAQGPLVVRYTKQAVSRGLEMSLEEGLALESRLASLVLATPDGAEGVRAYLERRTPCSAGC